MPDNLITLDQAVAMTSLYRQEKENILAEAYKGNNLLCICETFTREAFDTLLGEEACTAVRIYYGMSDDLQIHAIAVGVNSDNEDILPNSNLANMSDPPPVIEDGIRCPDDCPPKSPLNP